MQPQDIVRTQLEMSRYLLNRLGQDFTDVDAGFQPFPGGNHLIWILLHVAHSEDWVRQLLTGEPSQLPQEVLEHFGPTAGDCPAAFVSVADARSIFEQTRARTLALVGTIPAERYEDPAPPGTPPPFKTIGDLMALLGFHPFWHIGQLCVNRRLLNKPRVMEF